MNHFWNMVNLWFLIVKSKLKDAFREGLLYITINVDDKVIGLRKIALRFLKAHWCN